MLDLILIVPTLPPLLMLSRHRRRCLRRARVAAQADVFFRSQIAPMKRVSPPLAVNDPLAPVYEEVERELRRAGYLR